MSDFFDTPKACESEESKSPKKRLEGWKKILIYVLVLALLSGGIFATVKLIPEKEEAESSSQGTPEATPIKELSSEDISSLTVTNTSGTTEFYSTVEESTDDDGETTSDTVWHIKSVKDEAVDSYSIEETVGAIAEISYKSIITEKTAEACGLTESELKAVVEPTDGEGYTLIMGSKSPDNSGYYFMVEGEEDIYLVAPTIYTTWEFDVLSFADTTAIKGFEGDDDSNEDYYTSGMLSKFDRAVISGKNYPQTLELAYNTDEKTGQYVNYVVTKPVSRLAENTDALFSLYRSGITVTGAYALEVTSATLKEFGLNNPDLITTMYVEDEAITYKIALQEDGDYAVVADNSVIIHKASADTFADIIQLKAEDYYNKMLFNISIDDICAFKLTKGSEALDFSVKANESDEENDNDNTDNYIIKMGDKDVDCSSFQNLYAYCLSLQCREVNAEKVSGTPEIVLELTLNDGDKVTMEFVKASGTKYQCSIDGTLLGNFSMTDVERAFENAQKLANGKKLGTIV